MFDNYPDIVTINDLSKMLHIGKNTVYKLIHEKTIISFKIGNKILIPKSEVILFINKISRKKELNICYNNSVNSNAVVI